MEENENLAELPGEEWSGEIPEPENNENNEIPEPSTPEETKTEEKAPELVVVEEKVTYTPPVVTKTPTYSAPVATPEPVAEAKAEETTTEETPKETPKEEQTPESYLGIEVPKTATGTSLYLDRDAKITILSITATGIVIFSAIMIFSLITALKTSKPKKVNPLM